MRTYEEAINILNGLKYICMDLSVSEMVDKGEQCVFDLITTNLIEVIPVLMKEYGLRDEYV